MLHPHIRWMIRRDMPEILCIEADCYEWLCWNEKDFLRCLRQRNCIGMVAELPGDVIGGYMIYELHKYSLEFLTLTVGPKWQRQGIGRAFVEKLRSKLSPVRRTSLLADVRESNLAAQLFFKAMGFYANGVKRGHYEDTNEDAYRFVHRLPVESAVMLD